MFPVGMSLDEVKYVVTSHNEKLGTNAFIIAERGEYTIFNYLVSFDGTFPEYSGDPEEDRRVGILRECRGLTFHTQSGVLAARKFHKFFNTNQRAETQAHVIDWTQPHIIMEKLDGSMITPVGYGPSREWHTKMGLTDVAKPVGEFVSTRPVYDEFADMCALIGKTPIFEWCSRKQRIVIDYPEDQLVLLAVRDNHTGEYASYNQIVELTGNYHIPSVSIAKTCVFDIQQFLAMVRDLKGVEGFVVKFDSGLMVKMKAEEYCLQHAAKEGLELEKNVWSLILSDVLDDQLSLMTPEDRDMVSRFVEAFNERILETAAQVRDTHDAIVADIGPDVELPHERKKAYAQRVSVVASDLPSLKGLLFAAFDNRDLVAEIRKILSKSCGSITQVEAARPLLNGLRWFDFRYPAEDQ